MVDTQESNKIMRGPQTVPYNSRDTKSTKEQEIKDSVVRR